MARFPGLLFRTGQLLTRNWNRTTRRWTGTYVCRVWRARTRTSRRADGRTRCHHFPYGRRASCWSAERGDSGCIRSRLHSRFHRSHTTAVPPAFNLRSFLCTMLAAGHATALPVEATSISRDPTLKDAWGISAIRCTYRNHPDDLKTATRLRERAEEIPLAASAASIWHRPVTEMTVGLASVGTCRMGDDPGRSVIDRYHRTHDVPNLFLCDGSSLVTSGRGRPTMTT
jgi:hypothetical protein